MNLLPHFWKESSLLELNIQESILTTTGFFASSCPYPMLMVVSSTSWWHHPEVVMWGDIMPVHTGVLAVCPPDQEEICGVHVWISRANRASVWCQGHANFELARLKKKEIILPGSVLSWCFSTPLGVLLVIKALKDGWYVVIKVYKFTRFGEIFYVLSYIACPHRYPYIYSLPTVW